MENFGARYKVPPKSGKGGPKTEKGQGSKTEVKQGTKRSSDKPMHQSPLKKRLNQSDTLPPKETTHDQIGSSDKMRISDPEKNAEKKSEETGSPHHLSTFHPRWNLKKNSSMFNSPSVEMCKDFCLAPVLPQDKKIVDRMKDAEVIQALLQAESQVRTLTSRVVKGFEERSAAKEALRESKRFRDVEKNDHKRDLEVEQEKMKKEVTELNEAHAKALEAARAEAVQSFLLSEEFSVKKKEIEDEFCNSEIYAEKVWGAASNFYDYAFKEANQQLADKKIDFVLDPRLGLPKLFAFHGVPEYPIIPSHQKYQDKPDWTLSNEMMKNFPSPDREEEKDQDDQDEEGGGQGDEGQS